MITAQHLLAKSLFIKIFLLFFAILLCSAITAAQTGMITGRVTDAKTGEPLAYVNVVVKGTNHGDATDVDGNFSITNVPVGTYVLMFSVVGYSSVEMSNVNVAADQSAVVNTPMTQVSIPLGEVLVYGASRRPEKITEAPAAVTVVEAKDIKLNAAHGQLPRLLEREPGVDIVQSGIQDFNINTRGFNTSLNRRLLVLQDGRDLAIAFLGAQEWNGLSIPLDDVERLELVRGPGSALYGPNAFNGVISITTPSPKQVEGTKVSVSGAELSLLRADVRHAGSIEDRWSYKANIGRVQSHTWTKSRTVANLNPNNEFEYPGLDPEARELDTRPVTSTYGSARIDYDLEEGRVLTAEGGLTQVQNEVYVTGIGRVQVMKANKSWGRINFGSDQLNVMLWAQGRNTLDPQYSLASGAPLQEKSSIYHAEAQYNFRALSDQIRVILGASHRMYNVDTEGTLMAEKHDDNTSGIYGQVEYIPTTWIKFVGASRWDRSTLHPDQFSPKGAIVWTPDANHSVRATFNKAFQVPNYAEYFLQVRLGSVDIPVIGATPILVLGNDDLTVESITGYEIGYKGIFFDNKLFLTVDGYFNQVKDFVTDLLPGVNPDYSFRLPPGFPAGLADTVRNATRGLLTLVNGTPAIAAASNINAGRVDERGIEVGFNLYPTDEFVISGNGTWYDLELKEKQPGDELLANAPKYKFGFGVTYRSQDKYEVSIDGRNVQPFLWASGAFIGNVPAYTLVNLSAGYQITNNYRIGIIVSNVLDHDVYQIFGGSVIGRQAIGTVTATF